MMHSKAKGTILGARTWLSQLAPRPAVFAGRDWWRTDRCLCLE